MPQSSDDMRELMNFYFGDPIDDKGPTKFLTDRGYNLVRGWVWKLPKPDHFVTLKEQLCIQFLIEEWDFGGYVK